MRDIRGTKRPVDLGGSGSLGARTRTFHAICNNTRCNLDRFSSVFQSPSIYSVAPLSLSLSVWLVQRCSLRTQLYIYASLAASLRKAHCDTTNRNARYGPSMIYLPSGLAHKYGPPSPRDYTLARLRALSLPLPLSRCRL